MNTYKNQASGNGPSFSGIYWAKFKIEAHKARLILFLSFFLYMGCTPPPGDDFTGKWTGALPNVIQDGIEIPHFSSVAGQLNYASSGFRDKKDKSAALRAVASLFPEDRHACGHAALALAYLNLEPDYRFARSKDIQKAANAFRAVLETYAPFPDIQAKAHWYLGWIYTALDPQLEKGRAHFWTVIMDFSDVPMNLSPPAPWTNLVYSQPSAPPAHVPHKYWSQISLLEIIRQPGSPAEAIKAFNLLYNRFFMSTETGLALKAMLATPILASYVRPKLTTFIARYKANPYLVRDIKQLRGTGP